MVPRPGPIWGMPMVNRIGGKTTPNKPRYKPYGAISIKTDNCSNSVGGLRRKTVIIPPVVNRALFCTAGAFYKIKGTKVLIHADVNGAFNIVRKHVKDAFEGLERKQFLQAPQKIIIMKNRHARLKASA
jgi:hypothetical protein